MKIVFMIFGFMLLVSYSEKILGKLLELDEKIESCKVLSPQ